MSNVSAIYYFSTTGNSLAVALELAGKMGAPEPISIPGTYILDDPYEAARHADQVGFVFPVHRAGLPEMVRGFIQRMPLRQDCYYFAVSTFTLFGCNEFCDVDDILASHGCWLNYATAVKTMGNVGLLAPDTQLINHRLRQISQQVDEIAEAVSNYQENSFKRSSKILGKLGRFYANRRRHSIVFKVDKSCRKCGICVLVCPAKNIVLAPDANNVIAPIRSNKCEACLACLHWCPANAIGTKTRLHTHYHHPNIRPEQLNPVQSELEKTGENTS